MAMISSMGYWIDHNVNSVTDSAGWSRDNVNQITNIVNAGTPTKEQRKDNFDFIKGILNN